MELVEERRKGNMSWEAEYEALGEGDFMYLHLMAQYVEHFAGRHAAVIAAMQPNTLEREQAMTRCRAGLGVADGVTEGAPVSFSPQGMAPISGVVDFVSPSIIGVRTGDALYRFSYVAMGIVYLGHTSTRTILTRPPRPQPGVPGWPRSSRTDRATRRGMWQARYARSGGSHRTPTSQGPTDHAVALLGPSTGRSARASQRDTNRIADSLSLGWVSRARRGSRPERLCQGDDDARGPRRSHSR